MPKEKKSSIDNQEAEQDGPMGRTIKISDAVIELLGDIGKKNETYSQVIERIAREAHYEMKPEYIERAEEHVVVRRKRQQERA
jgi:predicted CopG family antitoxin